MNDFSPPVDLLDSLHRCRQSRFLCNNEDRTKKERQILQLQDHNNVNNCFSGEQERAWESSRAALFTCQRARRGDNDDDVDSNDNDDNTINFYQFDDDNGKRFDSIMMT